MKRLVAIAFLLAALVPSYSQQQLWLHGRDTAPFVFDLSSFFWYPVTETVKWYDNGGTHVTDLATFKATVDPYSLSQLDLAHTSVSSISNMQIFPAIICFVNQTTTLTNADARAITNWTSCNIYEHDDGGSLTNWDMSHCLTVAAVTFLNSSVSTIKMDSLQDASGLLSFQNSINIYNLSFPSLTNANGLYCNSDDNLTNIDVPELATIGVSTLTIGTAVDALLQFVAPKLVNVNSDILIESLASITNISMPLLTNANIVRLDIHSLLYTFNLTSLKTVHGGDLSFYGDVSLTNAVLPALTGVKTDIQFGTCTSLTNFSAPNLVLTNGNGVYFNDCALKLTPVNNLMILADASPGLGAATTIDLGPPGGNNAWPPTGAGLTAYNSLVAKGVTFVHP